MKIRNTDNFSTADWKKLKTHEWLHLVYNQPDLAGYWKKGRTGVDLFKDLTRCVKLCSRIGFTKCLALIICVIDDFQYRNSLIVRSLCILPAKYRKRFMDFLIWNDSMPNCSRNYIIWICSWYHFIYRWLVAGVSVIVSICQHPQNWRSELYTLTLWWRFAIIRLLLGIFMMITICLPVSHKEM